MSLSILFHLSVQHSLVDVFQDCSGMVEDLGEFMITGIGCMVVTASRGSERDE